MIVLPNSRMSADWHDNSLPSHTSSLHPAEYYHPRDPGSERKRHPLTDSWYHCSPSKGTYPRLSRSRNHANCSALSHCAFVTMNKVAVDISSFTGDWSNFSEPAVEWGRSNGICKCSNNILPLHWCHYQKRCTYSLFGKGINGFKQDAAESKKLALKQLT